MNTRPKPFVFVLMPFASEFDDVYQLGIKPSCERAGAYAERIDDQLFRESILDRIYTQISKADVIVADMTGRNPNVFYETGYAHALGKNVILLTRQAEDIPFDLKHYPHIVYRGRIADLGVELEKRIRWALENPEGVKEHPEWGLQFFYNGSLVNEDSLTTYYGDFDEAAWNKLKIDVHNPAEKSIRSANFELGIISGSLVHNVRVGGRVVNRINLNNGRYLHLPNAKLSILPGGWKSILFEFRARSRFRPDTVMRLALRAFSEMGVRDYPFRLKMAGFTLNTDEQIPEAEDDEAS